MAKSDASGRNWWSTLPGVITAVAGLITAIGGLIAILAQQGWWTPRPSPAPGAASSAPSPQLARPGSGELLAAPSAQTKGAAATSGVPLEARAYKGLRVTTKDRSVVDLAASAEISGATLPLLNGQIVDLEKIESVDIRQPWDGQVTLTLVNGQKLDANVYNYTLSGRNELGAYQSSLNELRRIEFVR